jgi:nucleotide-binding universal stress UspA family protein
MAAIQLNRLLCPVDLSDASRHALEYAIALAKWCGAQITVLHVYHIPIPPVPLAGPAVVPLQPAVDPRQLEDNVRRFSEPVAGVGMSLEIVIFSDSSLRAAEYALSLAKEADAQLILLHVIDSFLEERLESADVQFDSGAYRRVLEERVMARLRAVVPADARTWCKPDERIVYGKPHREILRVASEVGANAIFMGVHGRSVVDRMLFGSTTHHVIRQAPCPVLTLRA